MNDTNPCEHIQDEEEQTMQLCELIKELPYLVETRGDMSVEIASVTFSTSSEL